jgi:hypothetical protein
MRQSFLTKYIGKRIYVEKEAEIVSKNLFITHSEQKAIYVSGCWSGEQSSIRPSCIWDGKLRCTRGAEIPPGIDLSLSWAVFSRSHASAS